MSAPREPLSVPSFLLGSDGAVYVCAPAAGPPRSYLRRDPSVVLLVKLTRPELRSVLEGLQTPLADAARLFDHPPSPKRGP